MRGDSFWDAIEEHVAELDRNSDGSEVPNPWADVDVGDAGLSEEQVTLLAGTVDQPPVPHLDPHDLPGD